VADLRPDLGIVFGDSLGAAATITPPGGAAISTRVVVHPPRFAEFLPGSTNPGGQQIREISLRRDQVSSVKANTTIQITEGAESGKTYTVDAISGEDAEVVRVVVR